jgi:hypothetical protein
VIIAVGFAAMAAAITSVLEGSDLGPTLHSG